jgi:hypothetical protein
MICDPAVILFCCFAYIGLPFAFLICITLCNQSLLMINLYF